MFILHVETLSTRSFDQYLTISMFDGTFPVNPFIDVERSRKFSWHFQIEVDEVVHQFHRQFRKTAGFWVKIPPHAGLCEPWAVGIPKSGWCQHGSKAQGKKNMAFNQEPVAKLTYPLVTCCIAIENGHLQWVFPVEMVILFHSYGYVYKRLREGRLTSPTLSTLPG